MEVYSEAEVLFAVETAAGRLGYQLRQKQREAVLNFVRGRDVFVSLPTGSGKTLCYSILPGTFDILRKNRSPSIVLVISPLVALMKDQVTSLNNKGVTAFYIGGGETEEVVSELYQGSYQVVFCSPESLLTNDTWRDMLQSQTYRSNLVGFIVDEAHCVKKW